MISILCDSYTGCGCGVCSEDSYTELIVFKDGVHPELSGFVLDKDSEFY